MIAPGPDAAQLAAMLAIAARRDALRDEGTCPSTLARKVSATPHARRVLRRFVRHARALAR